MSRHPHAHEVDLEDLSERDYDSMKGWGISRFVTSKDSHVGKIWILAFANWLLNNGYQIVKVDQNDNNQN